MGVSAIVIEIKHISLCSCYKASPINSSPTLSHPSWSAVSQVAGAVINWSPLG